MGSMGKGIPGSFVTVIDDDGKEVGPNVKGNIAVPLDYRLYLKVVKDKHAKAASTGDYYVTGDQAHIDNDGYFWFEGRRDDIIISSGYTIDLSR